MQYGQEILIFGLDWARIHFVENNGMAFGWQLGGNYGKLILSLFRIVAVGFLIYYIRYLIKEKANIGLLFSFSLILAGAIGNIIDSAFYGLIFSDSFHGNIATLFPEEGGYSGFLYGRVVDMLYFPMFEGNFPAWFPLWGGRDFQFFKPVFNIADASISVGVINILLFQRSFFSQPEQEVGAEVEEQEVTKSIPEMENTEMTEEQVEGIEKEESEVAEEEKVEGKKENESEL